MRDANRAPAFSCVRGGRRAHLSGVAVDLAVALKRALQPKSDFAAQASHRAPGGLLKLFAKRFLKVKAYLDSFCVRHFLPMLSFVTGIYA